VVNAWHDVSPGNDLPRDFQAVIEIPLGSNVKYELDKATGLLKVTALSIPLSSIRQLWLHSANVCEDNDPLMC